MSLPEQNKREKEEQTSPQLLRNVIWISVAFFLLFTAQASLQNLQSSINCDSGLGVVSLSTTYVALIFSALFLPAYEIKHLGLKWTLVLNILLYNVYTIANFKPTWATMIIGAVVMGIAGGPLWAAQSTYITTSAIRYAALSKEPEQIVVDRFFGIFFFIAKWSSVFGNLCSSLLFMQDTDNSNSTNNFECGIAYCYTETRDGESETYCNPPDKQLINILLLIFLASGLLAAVFSAVMMFNMSTLTDSKDRSFLNLFFATMRLIKDDRQMLLIPLSTFSGLQKGFFFGDFTKYFITCTIGVSWIGYIMLIYGVVGSIMSVVSSIVRRWTGRFALFCFSAMLNTLCILFIFLWTPSSDEKWIFFIFTTLWGAADVILMIQLSGFYAFLFPNDQEAAFSNLRLWQSVGFAVAYAYSNFLCMWIKVTILGCLLGIGICGYVTVESNERHLKRELKEDSIISKSIASELSDFTRATKF